MESFSMKCFLLGFTMLSLQINGLYGCFRNERLALLDFKASVREIRGDIADLLMPSWTKLAKNGDCCKWERVKCNSTTGRVNMLFLDSVGPNYDDMSRWYPNISIFYPLTQLHTLNLSYNAIAGFVGIQDSKSFNLNKLETLDLRVNYVDKSVIKSLGQFKSLKSLYLQSNRITGPLSDQGLSAFSNLKILNLQSNQLNGTLPIQFLGNFRSLEILDLSGNELTGSIPPNIGHYLYSLKVLALSKNFLNGYLPTPGLCQLQKLEELDLSQNSFRGTIPECLGKLSYLRLLDVSENQLSGKISSSMVAGLTSLQYIDLSHNRIEGVLSFSSFSNHSRLEVVQIVNNSNNLEIETEKPSWIPSFQLKVLLLPNCNLNKFSGMIPKFLFQQHELRILDLSHNNLKGNLEWLRISNTKLEFVSLRKNSFVGQLVLPPLPKCLWIDVSENQLHGKIQTNIAKILPNVIYLNISKNAFEGVIPSSIGNMIYWTSSHTDDRYPLYKGDIPNFMSALDVSSNKLSGEIPRELGKLNQLRAMNLSHNQLTGSIPTTLSNLSQIDSMDLSHNGLSGRIPQELKDLRYLKFFSVAYNNLSGRIPDFGPDFGTIDNSSFQGNPLLCGVPLIKRCKQGSDEGTRT
ncbi:receptor like protein 21-like [Mercurialis annua]|uniref:receptor like protein 21-like n=1 Tax=Mercurialis annua TaxID=3986 RepID=UPI0021603A08|nr:receptor like protein 21-like [Mercurialis annua]